MKMIERKRNTRDRVALDWQAPLSSVYNTHLPKNVIQHFILINQLVRNLSKIEPANYLALWKPISSGIHHFSIWTDLLLFPEHPHLDDEEWGEADPPGYDRKHQRSSNHFLTFFHRDIMLIR